MDRFEDLNTFVAVAELGSVTRAAERLERAPSAVSRRLKELEARLGTQLLSRTTRRVALTPAGEVFLMRATRILAELDEAEARAGDDAATLVGQLRLTAPLSFGLSHLAPVIEAFAAAHPALVLDVDLTDREIDPVSARLDLAVRIGVPVDATLKSRTLARVSMVVAAAPAFWQARGVPGTPAELEGVPALCYSDLPRPAEWRWTSGETVRVSPRLLSSNGDLLVRAAVAGLGAVRLPSFLVDAALRCGELDAVLPRHGRDELTLCAVYPDTRFVPARTRAFIDHLAAAFAGEPAWERFAAARAGGPA